MSEAHVAQETEAVTLQPVDSATLKNTGKVLAVHLSYSSRAAQRGRVPANPSYFMKASSSLSLSGGTVERPAGTELLQRPSRSHGDRSRTDSRHRFPNGQTD